MSDKCYGVIRRTGDDDEITEFSYWFTKERAAAYATQENNKQDDGFHQYHVIEMDALPETSHFLSALGAKQLYIRGVNSYEDSSQLRSEE